MLHFTCYYDSACFNAYQLILVLALVLCWAGESRYNLCDSFLDICLGVTAHAHVAVCRTHVSEHNLQLSVSDSFIDVCG